MEDKAIDVWFGPGAEKGVFGAGVAHGLQESIESGELDASQIRSYGSSIGCLTAAFLASGNAGCGLQIFQEETRQLAVLSNLAPALAARIVNRLVSVTRLTKSKSLLPVPNVLNLDHVYEVMDRKTPNIATQLRDSSMQVFAETVDRNGKFRFTELRSAADPMQEIRHALHLFPFSHLPDSPWMDSGISGYGFIDLLRTEDRPLVVVLNAKPTTRPGYTLADLACAALSADFNIAQLYLRRRSNRHTACQHALQIDHNLLLIYPQQIIKLKDPSGYEASHTMGKQAARQIVTFLQGIESNVTAR
jgi:hypothetical protein